jgi:hypothetical protein
MDAHAVGAVVMLGGVLVLMTGWLMGCCEDYAAPWRTRQRTNANGLMD